MQFTNELLGSNLMFALTTGLYSRNLSCIREYVQNSYDESSAASSVQISIENGINLIIKDNGKGMNEEDLRKSLGVGLFTKNFEKSEGMYGIGIWSGVAVCNKLVIVTKKIKAREKMRVEIKCGEIRDNSSKNIPILKFLTDNTGEIEHIPVPENEFDKSYTLIRLEDITPGGTDLFTEKNLIEYISQNLPVPLSKEFQFREDIVKNFEVPGYYRTINITVNGNEVNRLYIIREQLRGFELKPFGKDNNIFALCWFSLNKAGDSLKKDRGFTLRHNGFVVRDWKSLRSEINGRFNDRFIGEIHLVQNNAKLKPTAPRNDLIQNEITTERYSQIRQFFSHLQRINSYVTVNIASPQKKMDQIIKADSLEVKRKGIKEIQNKNFKENLGFLEKDSSLQGLSKQLQQESLKVQDDFGKTKDTIEEEIKKNPPGRTELKKTVSSLTKDEQLQKNIETLMSEKHEGDLTLDPFNSLKESIEKLTKKKFSKFPDACNEIGQSITLFKGAKTERDSNNDVKEFFKHAYRIFRNLPEHAKGTMSTKWFDEAQNQDSIKAGVMALLTLIDNMIKRMTYSEDPGKNQ